MIRLMYAECLTRKKYLIRHMCVQMQKGLSGDEIAAVLNENPEQAFKTLVTVGKTGKNYVFVVPVNKELDLKESSEGCWREINRDD